METPTKRPPKNAPAAPTDYLTTPPKGLWYEVREGRDQPFIARWRLLGGTKESRAFASARDRADFAAAWLDQRRDYGRAAVSVSPREAEALAAFREITGGADLLTVAREWMTMRGVTDGRITLKEAVSKYSAAVATRAASEDSVAQRDLQLSRLLTAFPDARLADLTADKLTAWLASLAPPRAGGVAAPRTKRAHRGTVARLLDYAVGAGWLTRSPMAAVPIPVPESEDTSTTQAAPRRPTPRPILPSFRHLPAPPAGPRRRRDKHPRAGVAGELGAVWEPFEEWRKRRSGGTGEVGAVWVPFAGLRKRT